MKCNAHLDASVRPVSVALDGPSLLVRIAEDAAGRLPFGRIGAVVLRGPVRLEPEVVPALLRAGIAVTWLGTCGRNLGSAFPTVPARTDLAALLDDAEDRPNWPQRLDSWRSAEQRLAVVRTLVGLGLPWRDLRPGLVRRRLLRLLDERIGDAPPGGDLLWTRLRALGDIRVLHSLAEDGVGPRFCGRRGDEADPVGAVQELVAWSLWPIALETAAYLRDHAAKHRDEARLQRRIATQIEARAELLDRRTARLLASLRRTLREFLR